MLSSLFSLDHAIQHWINEVATNPLLDHLMAALTSFSAWRPVLIALIACGVIFGTFHLRVMILCLALTLGISDGIIARSLKHTEGRLRPFQAEAGIRQVRLVPASPQLKTLFMAPEVSFSQAPTPGAAVQGRSFPSAHATNITVAATILCLFYRRWRWLFCGIAFLVIYSRLYVGVHWPSDVLAGFCIGIVTALVTVSLLEKIWKRFGCRLAPALAAKYPRLRG